MSIAQTVLAYLRPHLARHDAHLRWLRLGYRSQKTEWPHWILYCAVKDDRVELVGAVPSQDSRRGKEWLHIVERHYEVLFMPWRMGELYSRIGGATAGLRALEGLYTCVEKFIASSAVAPRIRNRFRKRLKDTQECLEHCYGARAQDDCEEQVSSMERTLHLLHTIADEIGEELGFLPTGKSQGAR